MNIFFDSILCRMTRCKYLLFLACVFVPVCVFAQDPWRIEAPISDRVPYYGVAVGNGQLGITSSARPLEVKEVVLAGVYDMYGRGRVGNFLPVFNFLNTEIKIDGQSPNLVDIKDYTQSLDMRHGRFHGHFFMPGKATVSYIYQTLYQLPCNALLEITVTPEKDVLLDCANKLTTPSSLNNGQLMWNQIPSLHGTISLLTSQAKSPSGKVTIATSTSFVFPQNDAPQLLHEIRDTNMHQARFSKHLKAGKPYTFYLVGSVISSVQYADPLNHAERLTIYACLQGMDKLLLLHSKAWDKLWQSDIVIEGNKQDQQDIHNMMYHLYSFCRAGTDNSPSPMGLSGLGYNGHVFWDTELWMYPAMLLLHPEMAESMIRYRYNRLQAAKKNAFTYGYKGAMYPWESAATGVEETPVWALTGPFEHHITADVAIAAWQYYLMTQDKEWLKNIAWPILKETATFWVSRVEKNNQGQYTINNVVGADEWAENIDNDAFTNGAAIMNLRYAAKAAQVLGEKAPTSWTTIADNIYIGSMSNGVIREHDTYQGEMIKQADVNLLSYPLGIITDKKQQQRNLDYYKKKIPLKDTPAMTQAIYSLLYARLGDEKEAYHWFKDAYMSNIQPPFRVIAECKGGHNPYFITGAGGILQTVLMGFGGLQIDEAGALQVLQSSCPSQWSGLKIILNGESIVDK